MRLYDESTPEGQMHDAGLAFRRARDLIAKARALYAAGFEVSGAEYVQNARQVSRAGRLMRNEAQGTPEPVHFTEAR